MRAQPLLLGRNRRWTALTVVAAAILCVGGAVATALTGPVESVHPQIATLLAVSPATAAQGILAVPIVLAAVTAAVTAYLNDGVIPVAAVAAGPQVGIVAVLGARGMLAAPQGVTQTVGVVLGLGVPAFIVGTVVRRLRE